MNKGGEGRGDKTEEVGREEGFCTLYWPKRRAKKKGLRIKTIGVLVTSLHTLHWQLLYNKTRSERKTTWATEPAGGVVSRMFVLAWGTAE